jgi:hypothetical protein
VVRKEYNVMQSGRQKGDPSLFLVAVLFLLLLSSGTSTASSLDEGAVCTNVVFTDDFEDGDLKGWSIHLLEETARIAVEREDENGVLDSIGHVWSEAGDPAWTNYVYEVRFTPLNLPQPDHEWGCHINFRLSDGERYVIAFYPNEIDLWKDDGQGAHVTLDASFQRWEVGVGYDLRISCFETTIQVYLDNQLVFDVSDDEAPIVNGRIGIETLPYASHFQFDDVSVTLLITPQNLAEILREAEEVVEQASSSGADVREAETKLKGAKGAFEEERWEEALQLADDTVRLAIVASLDPSLYRYSVFCDDFEDGDLIGWTINFPEGNATSRIIEVEDNHVWDVVGQTWSTTGDPEWRNYILEVKVMFVNPSDCQINVRMNGGEERYIINPFREGVWIRKAVESDSLEIERKEIAFQSNVWYQFRIHCLNNSVGVYINGTLALAYTDVLNPYLSGKIGLEGSPESHVRFDDVHVYNLVSDISELLNFARREIDTVASIGVDVSQAEEAFEEALTAQNQGDSRRVEELVLEISESLREAPLEQTFLMLAVLATVAPVICLVFWIEAQRTARKKLGRL